MQLHLKDALPKQLQVEETINLNGIYLYQQEFGATQNCSDI